MKVDDLLSGDLSKYDADHLLPAHGLLSFFYETDTQCWGYDPADKGCARVFWFEGTTVLSAADFPFPCLLPG